MLKALQCSSPLQRNADFWAVTSKVISETMEMVAMSAMRFGFVVLLVVVGAGAAMPAAADVRFGKNVRIGGHDVSNQTFNSKRRGAYYIYNKTPANEGCYWRSNGDGSRTKVCHLKRKTR
jgi:hypothetical protein